MNDEARDVIEGDGYAVGSLDGLGEGYGFRKVRRELGVEAFGVNAIVIPAGYESGFHFHDEEDGSSYVLETGGLARVDPSTPRKTKNVGDEDAVIYVVGGKGGYVGRDGRVPPGEDNPRGELSGPPGAAQQ